MPGRELSPGTGYTGILILDFSLHNCEKINLLFTSPVYGILLWQPQLTNKPVKLQVGHSYTKVTFTLVQIFNNVLLCQLFP